MRDFNKELLFSGLKKVSPFARFILEVTLEELSF